MVERSAINALISKVRSGRAGEAIGALTSATNGAPTAGLEHAVLIEAWLAVPDRRRALGTLQSALKLPIEAAEVADALAFYARQLDQHDASNAMYRRAVVLAPDDTEFWYNLATSERTLGRFDEAREACGRALALSPEYRPAILLRSEMSKATASRNNVDDLRRRISASGEGVDAMFFHYALGKELHELGEYDDAFASFARGALIRRASLQYDVATDEAKLARIAQAFDGSRPEVPANPGRHLFIIGMPRSGTTLTERILGGLSGVRSNNETNNFSTALLSVAPQVGDVFANCAAADPAKVAAEYDKLAILDDFAGKVIEKLPFNYLYVGAIWRAFRGGRIVWVRRNPIDNCFAMFRTLFGAAYPFSYDFADLARYYAAYQRLMAHWEQLYPDALIKVDYESLVSNPDVVGSNLADRCGLPWRPGALDLDTNSSASLTASASQVRGEIYTSSSGIWRKYGRHLEPLVAGLERHGVEIKES